MAKKRKQGAFFRIFFWLCLIFITIYFAVDHFIVQPHIFYPGFQIEIPSGYAIHGIDVSKYQRVINWKEVAGMEVKGVRLGFVFIKATEGISLVDDQFRRNWLNTELQHIPRGAYHFFIPGRRPEKQANNFIEMVTLQKGDLPPVLDVEISRGLSVNRMQDEVKQWLNIVEKYYGVAPILYTNIDFYERYFASGFEKYPLWIAHYLQRDKPRIEYAWSFWQHNENGRVNGIQAPVDFNIFSGDSTAFKNLLLP